MICGYLYLVKVGTHVGDAPILRPGGYTEIKVVANEAQSAIAKVLSHFEHVKEPPFFQLHAGERICIISVEVIDGINLL
jgi:hypothetical protein